MVSVYITFKNKIVSYVCEFLQQMTLWSMAKSPLMFGGDMRNLDASTFSLITNPTLLEINSFSSNNIEACFFNNLYIYRTSY